MKRLILLTWFIALGASAAFGQTAPAKPASVDTTLFAKVDSLSVRIERVERSLDTLAILKSQREECLQDAHEYLDRSLTTLNIILVIVGVLVAAMTLIVTIVGNRVRQRASQFERLQFDLERQRDQLERQQETLGRAVEDARREFERIASIRKQAEREKEELSKTITLPSLVEKHLLSERLTDETRQKLDELAAKIREFEIAGGKLTADDYYNLGIDQHLKGLFSSALLSFEKAIELQPSYIEAWTNKVWVLLHLGRTEEAREVAETAFRLKPNDPDVLVARGISQAKLHQYEEAITTFTIAQEISPDDAKTYYNRACTFALMKKKTELLADLKRAIEFDSKFREIAKTDEDFKAFWDDPDFKKIVGEGNDER